jgi:hypothetical protein
MPTYSKCPQTVNELMINLMAAYDCYQPLIDAQLKVDLVFAFCDKDETTGEPLNDAIRHHGTKALGLCSITKLKDRVKGMGDVEILLDGDWWNQADLEQQNAVLDHELYHIVATEDKDDIDRPKIKMRSHDVDFGWFAAVALRHGQHSMEQQQAKMLCGEMYCQAFFPWVNDVKKGKSKPLTILAESDIDDTVVAIAAADKPAK